MTIHAFAGPIAFGRYAFDPRRGELHGAGTRPVALGRAARVLQALIDAAGHVLTPAQLVERAWPDRAVHASNLRVQIAALRRVLAGDHHLIGTVVGQGYVFRGDLSRGDLSGGDLSAGDPAGAARPPAAPALVGRDGTIDDVVRRCAGTPIVTLTGPAGVGKSALARAVAQRWPAARCRFVDMDSEAGDCPWLGEDEQATLLVLDNCDHRLDAVSRLAEALTRRLPRLRVLATSRQALGADGETVIRVAALACGDTLAAPALQLFAARAFDAPPARPMLQAAAKLCRRLDGVPLALLLAAAQVRAAGAACTPAGLESLVLRDDADAAVARHRSLRAALAWSEPLLPPSARTALAALAPLPSWFALDDAVALLPACGIPADDVVDCLATLAAHSLLLADTTTTPARYRLLATSRN